MTVARKTPKWLVFLGVVAAVVLLTAVLAADALRSPKEHTRSDLAMNTVITQKLAGPGAEDTATAIIDAIRRIEDEQLSRFVAGSDIARVNAGAVDGVQVGDATATSLKDALLVCKNSNGALDITVGALTSLWDIGGDTPRVPSAEELATALSTVDYRKVTVSGNTVTAAAGQHLDMGSVGKGLACDSAAELLRASAVKSAIVSVGGSVLLYGEDQEYRVGIRHPRGETNDYMGILTLGDCYVSTSGDYERTFTADGNTYHHLLDPFTGFPADSGLMSVTVVCDAGWLGDALSTACFVLGYEKSLPLLDLYDAQAVFVFDDYTVRVTPGLQTRFALTDIQLFRLVTEASP